MKENWNKRYSGSNYIYGKEPNGFFKNQLLELSPGNILLPGEGEGRNAVFAAENGWNVDAADYSDEGKKKAMELAVEHNVKINYQLSNLEDFIPKSNYYDAVGLIYIHLPEKLRSKVHRYSIDSLKAGGVIILEAFDKEQIKNDSGGPPKIELLYSLEDIFEDFQDLEINFFKKEKINLDESIHHKGIADVIRYVGRKN